MVGKFYGFFPILILVFANGESFKLVEKFREKPRAFNVYWNVPTFQCKSHKVYFEDLIGKFGIIQNKNDEFKGEEIAILYDPGNFPAILTEAASGKEVLRNGGVPQEGNLTDHLIVFKERVERDFPNEEFEGVAIIDFESWRPIYRQNWGTLLPYKKLSIEIEKQHHPSWTDGQITKEATRRFEIAGKKFVQETLLLAKSLRPNGTWGYYAYPYCYNMNGENNLEMDCTREVQKENDKLNWLFGNTDNLHPSLYFSEKRLTPKQRIQLIEGRIKESQRINKSFDSQKKILPYFWYKYQDTKNLLTEEDVRNSMISLKSFNIDGVIIWGSSNDVNKKEKCLSLYDYVEKVLGPAISRS